MKTLIWKQNKAYRAGVGGPSGSVPCCCELESCFLLLSCWTPSPSYVNVSSQLWSLYQGTPDAKWNKFNLFPCGVFSNQESSWLLPPLKYRAPAWVMIAGWGLGSLGWQARDGAGLGKQPSDVWISSDPSCSLSVDDGAKNQWYFQFKNDFFN